MTDEKAYVPTRDLAMGLFMDWNGGTDHNCWYSDLTDEERHGFMQTATDLLAAHDAAIKAEAWDEGFDAGFPALRYDRRKPNPYRAKDVTP